MKKRLLKWVLLFGCLVSGGWANAQSGVKYPYVTTDSKGVVNTIVCRDYRGGILAELIMPEDVKAQLHSEYPTPVRFTAGVGAAPKFRVAAKNTSERADDANQSSCFYYKEDPSDTENTWRYPTFMELNLIFLFYKQMNIFDAGFKDPGGTVAYVSLVAVNSSNAPFCLIPTGLWSMNNVSSSLYKYVRCVREVD